MKYIKTYELYKEPEKEELVDQLDDEIDDYFRDHYQIDVEEVAKYMDVFNYVDDDRFVEDYIEDYIQNAELDQFSKYDMKKYIENNLMNNEVTLKYLRKVSKKHKCSYEDALEYLGEKKLKSIIEEAEEEEDFMRDWYEENYRNSSAYDILSELYGERDLQENGYNYVQNYVDDDRMVEDFYDNEDYSYKREFVADQIPYDRSLQEKLLELKPSNALLLLDVMDENSKNSIGDEYDFQKKFMEEVIKQEDMDDNYPAEQLLKLYDKFGLDPDIEEEYSDYTYLIDAKKFNL